ncbi:winged helix DNA-binding domain-containing protein [Streptomyces griseoviridis]|uniref:winged helix DNA-binding domain-containing protein n=1 Tax=Streptomyces griseoviridis TaxID=45398 RepID=UPI0033C293CD
MPTVLDDRALNRATLARQLLLDRADLPVLDAVSHLCGLQAQEPQEPYTGLWSRLRAFAPGELSGLLVDRKVVRTHLMRRTVHLVTAEDALAWRARHAPMLRQRVLGTYRAEFAGVDLDELAADAAELASDGEPRTMPELARALAGRWPGPAPRALGEMVVAALLPMAQVPPRGVWRTGGGARNVSLAVWLGREIDPPGRHGPDAPTGPTAPGGVNGAPGGAGSGRPGVRAGGAAGSHGSDPVGRVLVRRYLAAFGPAATADLRAWSGVAGLPGAVAALRPELVAFRDSRGRELLDLPDAPRPDPDTPAPVRFLPAFDNALLGYQERGRIVADEHRGLSVAGERVLLVDGRVAGTWRTDAGTVAVTGLRPLGRAERAEVVAEGERLALFLSEGECGRVRIAEAG